MLGKTVVLDVRTYCGGQGQTRTPPASSPGLSPLQIIRADYWIQGGLIKGDLVRQGGGGGGGGTPCQRGHVAMDGVSTSECGPTF